MSEDLTVVSHEQDGRILSGVGATADDLATTMDRHTPAEKQVEPAAVPDATGDSTPEPPKTLEQAVAATPDRPRADDGTFKKVSRGQKRFDDLTREREAARREAAAYKTELDQLRARPTPAAEPVKTPPPIAATPAHTRTKPTEADVGSTYPTYADFVEDLADWKAEQRLSALDLDARFRQSIEADRASRTWQDSVAAAFAESRASYPDFDAALANGAGDVTLPGPMLEVVMSRPDRAHVLYRLASDKALAEQIAASNPYQAGLLLAQAIPASTGALPASPARAVPPPPPPYQPVAGGSKTTGTPSADLPKAAGYDFDKSGYREKRAAERGVLSRR